MASLYDEDNMTITSPRKILGWMVLAYALSQLVVDGGILLVLAAEHHQGDGLFDPPVAAGMLYNMFAQSVRALLFLVMAVKGALMIRDRNAPTAVRDVVLWWLVIIAIAEVTISTSWNSVIFYKKMLENNSDAFISLVRAPLLFHCLRWIGCIVTPVAILIVSKNMSRTDGNETSAPTG